MAKIRRLFGDVCPESNRYPDFVFDYQGKGFAVECKWREKLQLNVEKDLFSTDKMAIYQQFSTERNIPVFIVLGVGGEPSNPELLYNIPLSEIPSVLSRAKSIVEFLRPSVEIPSSITDFIPLDGSDVDTSIRPCTHLQARLEVEHKVDLRCLA